MLAANSFTRISNFLTRLGRGASPLYCVSVNESLQHLRKQRRRRWVSLESDFMDRQPNHERDLDHKELMEHALARLEPELRSLFLLREVE